MQYELFINLIIDLIAPKVDSRGITSALFASNAGNECKRIFITFPITFMEMQLVFYRRTIASPKICP